MQRIYCHNDFNAIQMSLFDMIIILKQLQKNCTFEKTLVTNFLKPLDLLILKYVRSF